MSRNKEIICLVTTLNIFRAYKIFPKRGEELNPGIDFYIKYSIGCLLASVILFGSALHFVHTVIAEEYNHIDLDLAYVLSMTSGFLLFILFSLNTNAATKMYMFLSDFKEFGKPPKFDIYNTFLNKLAKYHFIYLGVTVSLFAAGSNVFKSAQCYKDNAELGYKEICGLVTNTWLPFDIDYFPAKQIYAVYCWRKILNWADRTSIDEQSRCVIFAAAPSSTDLPYYVYMLSGTITFMVMETIVHVGIRLDHVKQLFVDAINDENAESRRKMLYFAVRYHARVLELEHELNMCFKNAMFTHMVLTAAIIGCAAFGVMQSGSANPFAICVGWINGMSVVCISGQHLTNKSLEVGAAIYDSKWYEMEPALKRDLAIVIMRCHKAMVLRAAGFGVMNHATILAVMQASYSYITLLSRSP